MNNKNFFINESAFDELCKYVCWQIQPSGSEHADRETLNFAIYWQLCLMLEKQVEFVGGLNSKISGYQQLVQNMIDSQIIESFDVSEIIDRNILELFQKYYVKTDNFSVRGTESQRSFFKSFTFS